MFKRKYFEYAYIFDHWTAEICLRKYDQIDQTRLAERFACSIDIYTPFCTDRFDSAFRTFLCNYVIEGQQNLGERMCYSIINYILRKLLC